LEYEVFAIFEPNSDYAYEDNIDIFYSREEAIECAKELIRGGCINVHIDVIKPRTLGQASGYVEETIRSF